MHVLLLRLIKALFMNEIILRQRYFNASSSMLSRQKKEENCESDKTLKH